MELELLEGRVSLGGLASSPPLFIWLLPLCDVRSCLTYHYRFTCEVRLGVWGFFPTYAAMRKVNILSYTTVLFLTLCKGDNAASAMIATHTTIKDLNTFFCGGYRYFY